MFGGGFGVPFGNDPFAAHEDEEDVEFEDEEGEVENSLLYQLLDLEAGANIELIKKAYRKKVVKIHPDKGGDPEEFRKVQQAYEVLSNEETKTIYDRYGQKGLEQGFGKNSGNPLADLFGFGGQEKGGRGEYKKVRPRLEPIKVSLEDVYVGKMVAQTIKKKKICEDCQGKGGQNSKQCETCKGKKMVMGHIQIGPGMYAQSQVPCDVCKAQGIVCEESDICKICQGECIVEIEKVVDVALEKGVPNSHHYKFVGYGDEQPDANAGDIIFEIQINPHDKFLRKGADLYYNQKISLKEALVGTYFQIKHLDDEILYISTNKVIKTNQIQMIPNKGMPFFKDEMNQGHLFIQFEVEFPTPDSLSQEQKNQLSAILPGPEIRKFTDGLQIQVLQPFDMENTNPHAEGGSEKPDQQQEGPQQGVQCAQQ